MNDEQKQDKHWQTELQRRRSSHKTSALVKKWRRCTFNPNHIGRGFSLVHQKGY